MTESRDPLDVLRSGDIPVRPEAGFAARLRARLVMAAELAPPPPPRPAAIPYLAVSDARRAISWYTDALGARPLSEPIVMPDGRIGHAELELAGGVLYLADEYPELGLASPAPAHVSVSLMIEVPDVDSALRRARDRGATVQREPYEGHGSRNATVLDPFGHRWMLTGPTAGAVRAIRPGDVGYVTVRTPDPQRAAAFYGRVLGWTLDPASGWVHKPGIRVGFVSGAVALVCYYAVDDLTQARAAVLDGGGTVDDVERHDFGTALTGTDANGARFGIYQPAPDDIRPALNGSGPGDLSYLTYETPDSAVFRSFWGRVLQWTFEPGRIMDGWAINDTHPMAGAAGGNPVPATVPMWTVTDIHAAVEQVRAAGGTVLEGVSRQDYGSSALCTDDQGSRFYLGQH
jgi:predicted enzyme related to lactoylglutathione lyase